MRTFSVLLMTSVVFLGFTNARAEQTWRAVGGSTSMFFFDSILAVNGFTLSPISQTGTDPFGMENSVAFMGNDIGVARQHDTARDVRADRGIEIGLAAFLVINPDMRHVPAIEIILDFGDERQIGFAARRVMRHEAAQHRG